MSANILPSDDDYDALKKSKKYCIVIILNQVFCLICLFMLLTLLRYETPKWYIATNKDDKAIEAIAVYTKNGDP